MTELFPWEGRYELGIEEIDEQHKRMVGMINSLHEGMSKGRGREKVGGILIGLMDYSLVHFRTEEGLMERNGYPRLGEHRAEHTAFMDRVGELSERHDSGELFVSVELNDFMKAWLSSHILSSDREYVPFLKGKAGP